MSIKLGSIAQDKYSGFKGTVIAKTTWLYGCDRVTLKPHGTNEGKTIPAECFDEPQVDVVDEMATVVSKACPIMLGSRVKDRITGFEGIAAGIV